MNIPMVPQGLAFHGKNFKNSKEECSGYVPYDGEWDDAAARFGTVKDYAIEESDPESSLVWLSSGDLTDELVPYDLDELEDQKLQDKIVKYLEANPTELIARVLDVDDVFEIVDVRCPPKDDDELPIEDEAKPIDGDKDE